MVFDIRHYLLGSLALNVAAFFVITMVCHGELSRSRPAARHLTGVLHVDVGRRRDRRHLRRADRAEHLLLGDRVSGADRARDPVPAGPRNADRHAHAPVLARRRCGRRRRGVPRPDRALRHRREGVQLDHRRHAGGRRAGVARAAAVRRRDRGRVHHRQAYRPDSEVRETMRSFFGVHKITETSDGQFRVFLHGTTIHGAERLRDDAGRADHRPAADDHLLSCELADGRDRQGGARARRRADQGRGGRPRHRHLRVLLASRATTSSSTRSTRASRSSRAMRTASATSRTARRTFRSCSATRG